MRARLATLPPVAYVDHYSKLIGGVTGQWSRVIDLRTAKAQALAPELQDYPLGWTKAEVGATLDRLNAERKAAGLPAVVLVSWDYL